MTRLLWSLWPLAFFTPKSAEPVPAVEECLQADPANPQAIKLCASAIQETGPTAPLLLKRALAYEADHQYAQALADFEHAADIFKEVESEKDDPKSEKKSESEGASGSEAKEEEAQALSRGKARVLLALGRFEQAEAALETVQGAAELLKRIKGAAEKSREGSRLVEGGKWGEAERVLEEVLQVAPAWVPGHSLRVRALMAAQRWQDAQRALQQRAQWELDANDTAFQVAKLQLAQGHLERGRKLVDDCARDDPDHRACHKLRKRLKEIGERLEAAKKLLLHPSIEAMEALLTECKGETERSEPYWDEALPKLLVGWEGPISAALCNRLVRVKRGDRAVSVCKRSLELAMGETEKRERTIELAQAHRWAEEWEEATALLNGARKQWPRAADLNQALREINEARKQAGRRDYYAILGVPKEATDDQIQRAYNKAARRWHPDKQRNEEDKKRAIKKMQEINAAYAILRDPAKRKQVDAGLDPENPEDQAAARNPFYGAGGAGGFGGINIEDLFRAAAAQGGSGGGGFRSSYGGGSSYGSYDSYGAGGTRRKRQQQQQRQGGNFYDFFKDDL